MINIFFITYLLIPLFFCYKAVNFDITNVKFADGKTITQCIIGLSKLSSRSDQNTPEKIMEEGYPVEEHVTLTEDGYLLTLFRIPGPKGAPAILINHGFLGSSFDWVVTGKKRGLPFLLADKNYDVWLGNLRGSTYSRCHTKYRTSDDRFWDFSLIEFGKYDLPAQIDYITNIKQDDIIYIGYSMGTTSSYILAIEKPNIATKLKAIFSLAPIAFLSHAKSSVRLLAPFGSAIANVDNFISNGEILSNTLRNKLFNKFICELYSIEKKICAFFLFLLVGFNKSQWDYALMPKILDHFPAGGSIKTLNHFGQLMLSEKFQNYDYGIIKNLKIYNSIKPPEFNISKIQVPVGLFGAENDFFSSRKDVKHLADLLPKKIITYEIFDPQFNHFDFLWGKNAPELVYSKLISEIEYYR